MMKLLFVTLLGFFVTSCTVQDLSSYTDINSTESLEKKFEITPIYRYFYVTNNENEKQIIASSDDHLYKFDQSGNLIDTLKLTEYRFQTMYNIQPENHFIYLEDGYIPNWIKTGDKTKHQYHKVYNEDLTMDLDVMKQVEKMRDDAVEQYRKGVFDDDDYNKQIDECYDYFYERSELRKLLKTLNQQAKYKHKYSPTFYLSYVFVINNEVIKVRISNELESYSHNIESRGRYINYIPQVIPKFPEWQKSFHFEKEEWVKRFRCNFHSTCGRYWKGTAYYDLPIGESILKIKVKDDVRANSIKINRNIFLGNKKFVLIEASQEQFFIKEK